LYCWEKTIRERSERVKGSKNQVKIKVLGIFILFAFGSRSGSECTATDSKNQRATTTTQILIKVNEGNEEGEEEEFGRIRKIMLMIRQKMVLMDPNTSLHFSKRTSSENRPSIFPSGTTFIQTITITTTRR